MKKINKDKTYYYKTFEDDFVVSKNQNYKLSDNYKWIHNNIIYRICSNILYCIAYIFSIFYCKFFLHVKVKNGELLNKYKKQGYFIYGNHTQPIGDVFIPTQVCKTKRIYTIASPSNLGVAVIGPLLPMLGILPIPTSVSKMKELLEAVNQRIKEKHAVIIYPEAHLWPYYTKIRPFSSTAFKFPVDTNSPSFCMTTTYYKRKFGKKPGIMVYIDGPFVPDESLPKKERKEKLCQEIYECAVKRSKNSIYEYIKYKGEKK